MRRLNVQQSQIEECIRTARFAISSLPRNPPLQRGEPLLLQLVLQDARPLGKEGRRIEFALIFDRVEEDPTGEISRHHWPAANRTWRYILRCSEAIPTIPFSLENLDLSDSYGGQQNPATIHPVDEARVRPYLLGETAPANLWSLTGVDDLLWTIRNYDSVQRLSSRTAAQSTQRRAGKSWLTDALKRLYDHQCQVCLNDFEPRYGVPYADARVVSEGREGSLRSQDLVVVCPNHNAIIGATKAQFDRRALAFEYPNGLVERVRLRDHLLSA